MPYFPHVSRQFTRLLPTSPQSNHLSNNRNFVSSSPVQPNHSIMLVTNLLQNCNSVDSSLLCAPQYSHVDLRAPTSAHHLNTLALQQHHPVSHISQFRHSNGSYLAFAPTSLSDLTAATPDVIGRGHPGVVGATLEVKQEHSNLPLGSSDAVPQSGGVQPMTGFGCGRHLGLAERDVNVISAVPLTLPQVQRPAPADRPFSVANLESAPTPTLVVAPSDTAATHNLSGQASSSSTTNASAHYSNGHWTPSESAPAGTVDQEPSIAALPLTQAVNNPSQSSVSQRSEFVRRLVDIAATIIESIWPKTHSAHPPTSPKLLPLRPFIESLLRRSRTSFSTLQLSLFYLLRLCTTQKSSPAPTSTPSTLCGRRMFLASLVVASKYLQDRNFSNKAWAKICQLEVAEVNAAEREFLGAVGYRVHVEYKTFVAWSAMLLQRCGGSEGVKGVSTVPQNVGVESRVAGLENGVLPTPRVSPDGNYSVVDEEAMRRADDAPGEPSKSVADTGNVVNTSSNFTKGINTANVVKASATTASIIGNQTANVVNHSIQSSGIVNQLIKPERRMSNAGVGGVAHVNRFMTVEQHQYQHYKDAKRSDPKRVRSPSCDGYSGYSSKRQCVKSR